MFFSPHTLPADRHDERRKREPSLTKRLGNLGNVRATDDPDLQNRRRNWRNNHRDEIKCACEGALGSRLKADVWLLFNFCIIRQWLCKEKRALCSLGRLSGPRRCCSIVCGVGFDGQLTDFGGKVIVVAFQFAYFFGEDTCERLALFVLHFI